MAKPINTDECLEAFCGHVTHGELNAEDKQLLNDNRVEVKYNKGENICKQGSFANHLIYIKEGLTKSYLEEDDNVQTLCVNPANNILGIQSVTTESVFHYSVAALEDVYACLFDMKAVKVIAKRNAGFAYELLIHSNQNQVLTFDRLFSLTMKQLHGRMADIILCLHKRVYQSDTFTVNLSRKDLAELTAMSNESATRILKDFKDDKIIDLDGKTISILDKDKLIQVSKFG